MWYQFIFENLHFAINLFAALAFFSIFWLYFDAWFERKTVKEAFKIVGFLLLSLAFLTHATLIESSGLVASIFTGGLNEKIAVILKTAGYLFLIIGLVIDPLIPKPKYSAGFVLGAATPYLLAPVLTAITAWLYLRRATIGLENHTKKVTMAFYFLAGYELLAVPSLFINSSNVDIFKLVSPFGPIWIASHLLQIIGTLILLKWAFSYLLKRLNTQLFIIFTTTTLAIFLLTTISFTFLLLKNISDETLVRLNTDVSVLSFAMEAKKTEAIATASILSQNLTIVEAIKNNDRKTMADEAEKLLTTGKVNSVVVVNEAGQVLARGEERDRIGDSLSSDSLVKRTLLGENAATLTTKEAAMAPIVLVKAAVPIMADGKVIGVTIISTSIDNNFLDGIKKVTGLEVGIYGNEILSATTISEMKGVTRPIGIKESNDEVKTAVLAKGETYSGLVSILNTSYFAVYHPLKNINNEVMGMILVGRPSISIFATAGKSIEVTFLVAVILIVFLLFPSYFISKRITDQLR